MNKIGKLGIAFAGIAMAGLMVIDLPKPDLDASEVPQQQINEYYKLSFENGALGSSYVRKLWKEEIATGNWDNGLSARTKITDKKVTDGSKALEINYPKGGFGTSQTGTQVELQLPSDDEYYASYDVQFDENFSFGGEYEGGKLPGLTSGKRCSSTCDGTDGFGTRYMWRRDGQIVLYLFHMDKEGEYGDDIPLVNPDGTKVKFEKGKWYNLKQHVKVNSAPDKSDGEITIWVNDVKVLEMKNIRLVSNDDGIDTFYMSSFHGGSTAKWAPLNDSKLYIDNIEIYNYK